MEGGSGVTRSIIDQLKSSDKQGDQMKSESGVTPSIIDEVPAWNIQGDENEGESGVYRSIIDDLRFSDIQPCQMEVKVELPEVSLMNIIVRIFIEIK